MNPYEEKKLNNDAINFEEEEELIDIIDDWTL